MVGEDCRRKIRLYCPSVSKMIDWVAWNNQRLDFASIAGAFGLAPSTVKLNGHFISRDIDFFSAFLVTIDCVTWQSLLAFFSAKGLSTGKDEADALFVDGKVSKVGNKRTHYDPQEELTYGYNDLGPSRNKKLKDKCSGIGNFVVTPCGCNKRKLLSEDTTTNLLKKLKLNIDDSFGISKTPLKCSFISDGLKRTREDDMIASASCKKIR